MNNGWAWLFQIVWIASIIVGQTLIWRYRNRVWRARVTKFQQRIIGLCAVIVTLVQFLVVATLSARGGRSAFKTPGHFGLVEVLMFVSMCMAGVGWLFGANLIGETLSPLRVNVNRVFVWMEALRRGRSKK